MKTRDKQLQRISVLSCPVMYCDVIRLQLCFHKKFSTFWFCNSQRGPKIVVGWWEKNGIIITVTHKNSFLSSWLAVFRKKRLTLFCSEAINSSKCKKWNSESFHRQIRWIVLSQVGTDSSNIGNGCQYWCNSQGMMLIYWYWGDEGFADYTLHSLKSSFYF